MAACLAREYTDESVCSAGAVSPLAMTSYLLARRTHAPGLTLITTSGGYVDVAPRPMLLGLGETLDYKTAIGYATGDGTYHRYYQSGRISHEMIATAQVDRFGTTNTIEVRSPSGRMIRLPGQGGMADVANMHQHFLLYVTRHSPLALVDRVDVSSAARGLLTDEERLAEGLRPGVVKLVTNLCIFELDHTSRELRLVSLHPGVELAEIERETGFEVVRSPSLDRTPASVGRGARADRDRDRSARDPPPRVHAGPRAGRLPRGDHRCRGASRQRACAPVGNDERMSFQRWRPEATERWLACRDEALAAVGLRRDREPRGFAEPTSTSK